MKIGRPLTVLVKSRTRWLALKSNGRRGGFTAPEFVIIGGLYRISDFQRYRQHLMHEGCTSECPRDARGSLIGGLGFGNLSSGGDPFEAGCAGFVQLGGIPHDH